mmetsp:Transcript_77463/g.151981  ORF Transcript_77463/g.151981 Transcript_77463/m.151981 type:complete len:225 (+) Transcript_77463:108-782(+)
MVEHPALLVRRERGQGAQVEGFLPIRRGARGVARPVRRGPRVLGRRPMEKHRTVVAGAGELADAVGAVGEERRRAAPHASRTRFADEGDILRGSGKSKIPLPGLAAESRWQDARHKPSHGEETLHRGPALRRPKVRGRGEDSRPGPTLIFGGRSCAPQYERHAHEAKFGKVWRESREGRVQRPPVRFGRLAVLQGHDDHVPLVHRGGRLRGLAIVELRVHDLRR